MAYILGKNSVAITVPAGQSIRIDNFRGMPMQLLTVEPGRVNGPIIDIPAQNITYGSYSAATNIVLVNNGFDAVEYVVAASPGLVDAQYNPSNVVITAGNINSTTVGATTPSTGSFTSLRSTSMLMAFTDNSGAPGNTTINTVRGRAAFAAAAAAVTVTSSQCAANSTVLVSVRTNDATLKSVSVVPGAGSFVVTGNAAAAAITAFDFVVIQN